MEAQVDEMGKTEFAKSRNMTRPFKERLRFLFNDFTAIAAIPVIKLVTNAHVSVEILLNRVCFGLQKLTSILLVALKAL